MDSVKSFIPKPTTRLPKLDHKLENFKFYKGAGRTALRRSKSFSVLNVADIHHGTKSKIQLNTNLKTTHEASISSKINKSSIMKGAGRVALRRSKSFSDLNIGDIQTGTKSKIHLNTNLKTIHEASISSKINKRLIIEVSKSKSYTSLCSNNLAQTVKTISKKRPLVNISQKPDLSKRSKIGLKNHDKEGENKVPPKPKKPASYDYKARFNLLNEKHVTLREAYNEIKQSSAKNNDDLVALRNENSALLQKINVLEKDEERLKVVEQELKKIELENKQLQLKNELLIKDLSELSKDHTVLKEKYDSFMKIYQVIETNLTEKTKQLEHALFQQEEYKNELQENEINRRMLHNMVQNMKGNIRVFCRIRPSLPKENEKMLSNINCIDEATLEISKAKESISFAGGKVGDLKMEFLFDKVFAPAATQNDVFEDLAQLVQSALDGYHICVFAYGQTGSGKTYTMQGEETNSALGIIPRSMNLLFETIKKHQKVGWEYTVEVSFLEIYNEIIRDLLDSQPKLHEIRYNEGKGVTVTNLKIQPIETVEEFRELMFKAHKNRAVAVTNFNEHSSRSHAVTKIYLQGINNDFKVHYTGSINLVDLAGSERAKTTSSERLMETKNINRSLSALGNVILALHNKDSHIPYRNSKLTYLLQSCLEGNSKTLMIVNVSPFEECYNETVSSLRFAATVKQVKVNSRRNKTYIE